MRRITLGRTGIETSALGFGCASLGSRVSAEDGVRALEAAYQAGVTWFDLAPVYGGGRAEEIAAPFLRAHRDSVQICTKAGLTLAGGAGGTLRAALMPLARRVLAAAGPLGASLRRAAPKANAKLALTPELLTGSLEASLRRLGTDRVELFALHAVAADELGRDEILRALEAILASGKARAVAVASDVAAADRALAQGAPFSVIQMPLPQPEIALPTGTGLAGPVQNPNLGPASPASVLARARAAGFGTITHSVFGFGGSWDLLRRRLAADPAMRAWVAKETGRGDLARGDSETALAEALLARAFAINPQGVVVVSMFSARSLRQNAAAAAGSPRGADGLDALWRRPEQELERGSNPARTGA